MTPASDFRFAASLSTRGLAAAALDEALHAVAAQLGAAPDLAFLFASAEYGAELQPLAERLVERLAPRSLAGCTGESIVGGDREIENAPALALWAARLPGATIEAAHIAFQQTADGPLLDGWPQPWTTDEGPSSLIVLGEPFSFPADYLTERLHGEHPRWTVVGGMASGGQGPGENRLFLGGNCYDAGAVAVRLSGPLRMRTVVSQGCRPIGKPLVVTRAERNIVFELGGRPAYQALTEVYETLSDEEQALLRTGLHLGRVTSEYRESFQRGDFLVRNVIGADPQRGALAIGDFFRAGQTVQFHLRDAASADEDLRELLRGIPPGGAPRGGLLFTCNGRGTRLFEEADHDAAAVRAALGPLPLAGFFAQGEIGPIGGKSFVHGFTASLAVLEPDDPQA